MIPEGICSKCKEDFMNCRCEQFHPNITFKGMPIHSCDKVPVNTPHIIPLDWKHCPFCGEEINKV